MQDFIYFLGRFHVLVLHLPIGIVLVAVALDWVARREPYRGLAAVAPFLWGFAAISAVVTAALGYMHFSEGGFTGASAYSHRLFGTAVAVVTVVIWWLCTRDRELYRKLNIATGTVAVALVAITGHYGGNLTHGSEFLLQYAPWSSAAARRPPVTSVAAADPYLDVVQPLLEQRCGTCHNDDKRENDLSLASYEATLAGGETGRAVVPGDSGSSELYRRISLPPDDEEFMPAEGKTPLTAAQVEILRWWIDAGAPHDVTLGETGVDSSVAPLLSAQLGLDGVTLPAAAAPVVASSELVDELYRSGFLVRQVSQTDPRLVVSVYSPGARVAPQYMAVLESAAHEIVELNLQDAGLDDTLLERIGMFTELTRLRLSRNDVSDRTVAAIASSMPNLERLNLYANPDVTDASVDVLAGMSSLRRLDIWRTSISEEGMARLRDLRPDLELQGETADVIRAVEPLGPPPNGAR